MEHIPLNIKVPESLVWKIDELIKIESEKIGIRLDRTKIIRRAIESDVTARLEDIKNA